MGSTHSAVLGMMAFFPSFDSILTLYFPLIDQSSLKEVSLDFEIVLSLVLSYLFSSYWTTISRKDAEEMMKMVDK